MNHEQHRILCILRHIVNCIANPSASSQLLQIGELLEEISELQKCMNDEWDKDCRNELSWDALNAGSVCKPNLAGTALHKARSRKDEDF